MPSENAGKKNNEHSYRTTTCNLHKMKLRTWNHFHEHTCQVCAERSETISERTDDSVALQLYQGPWQQSTPLQAHQLFHSLTTGHNNGNYFYMMIKPKQTEFLILLATDLTVAGISLQQ